MSRQVTNSDADSSLTQDGTALSPPLESARSDSQLHAGDQIGDFIIIAPPQEGGMGYVWKATRKLKGTLHAVKRPKNDADHERFAQREVAALKKLAHPNLQKISEAVDVKGTLYLVTEWIEGENLAEWCNTHGRPEPLLAIEIWLQAAQAVAYMHDRGIVHRDLKPANIMIREDGHVVVIDLGGVAWINHGDSSMEKTSFLGTRTWEPPAHIRNSVFGDQYTLGMLLCWLLTGQKALFPGTELPSGLKALEHVICRTANTDPNSMFSSVDRMISAASEHYSRTDTLGRIHQASRYSKIEKTIFASVFVLVSLILISGLVPVVWYGELPWNFYESRKQQWRQVVQASAETRTDATQAQEPEDSVDELHVDPAVPVDMRHGGPSRLEWLQNKANAVGGVLDGRHLSRVPKAVGVGDHLLTDIELLAISQEGRWETSAFWAAVGLVRSKLGDGSYGPTTISRLIDDARDWSSYYFLTADAEAIRSRTVELCEIAGGVESVLDDGTLVVPVKYANGIERALTFMGLRSVPAIRRTQDGNVGADLDAGLFIKQFEEDEHNEEINKLLLQL